MAADDDIVWDDDIKWDEPKPKTAVQKAVSNSMLPWGGKELLETVLAGGSGFAGSVLGGIGGLGRMMLSGPEEGAKTVERIKSALTYEPESTGSQNTLKAIGFLPEKYSGLVNRGGEKITDVTGSPSLGAQYVAAAEAVPNVLGLGIRGKAPTGATKATLDARKAAQVAALTKDTAATDASAAGFALPPSQVNPSWYNRLLEWYAGSGPTADKLGIKNQPTAQAKYRGDLEILPEVPLDKSTFKAIVQRENPHYEAVRKTGESAVSNDYVNALVNMEGPISNVASKYPKDAPPPILKDIDSLLQGRINADAALTKIEDLRNDARKAGSGLQPDTKLAAQYWKLSNILEAELDRHLQRVGAPAEVIENYRTARETIAKAKTAKQHTKPSGEVDATRAAKDLDAPFDLTGGMRETAEFGANFPRAARLPSRIGSGSAERSLTSLLGGGLVGDLLASNWYQKKFVKPPTYGDTMGDAIVRQLGNPAYPMVGQSSAQAEARKRELLRQLGLEE